MSLYDEYKARLEQKRTELLIDLDAEIVIPDEGMGYSTHQADDATFATDQAASAAIRRNIERQLYEVERALHRLENGSYGLCRTCKKEIDRARLKAIPYARDCMDCASHHESH